jgi:hypothetical protein
VRAGTVAVEAASADAGWSAYCPVGIPVTFPLGSGDTHIAALATGAGTLLMSGRA